MSGRAAALITGANRGIGRETAKQLARLGHDVLLVCRDARGAERVAREIRRECGPRAAAWIVADLSRPAEARRAAVEAARLRPDIGILVNNAAVLPRRRIETTDGLELQLAVNHVAGFVLAHAMLHVLEANAPARIVNVASEAHRRGRLDLDDFQARRYRPRPRYDETKLMNVLFTRALARRLEGTGVTCNALHPGVVATGLLGNFLGLPRVLKPLVRPFFASEEEGARTPVYVAHAPELEGVSGRYFKDARTVEPADHARDDIAADALWRRTEECLGALGP